MAMQTIKLKRGDDEQRRVELKIQTQQQFVAFDLSAVARADLHAVVMGKQVLELSTTNGQIELLDREQGQLLLTFPHILTQNATWDCADYDLQLIYRDGRVKTVLSGKILLSADVTKVEM